MKMKRVVTAVMLVFGWAVLVQAEVFTFQQGIDGYEGGQDVTIYDDKEPEPIVVPPSAGSLLITAFFPNGEEVYNTLIRFESLADVLGGKEVLSAEIELTHGNLPVQDFVPAIVETYSIGKNWHDPNAAWDEANGGLSWEVDGAQGSTDRTVLHFVTEMRARPSFSQRYYDGEKFIFALDATEVQAWVDNPAGNNGVLMVMDDAVAMTSVLFHSNESTAEEGTYRPLLRVTAFSCLPIPGDINHDCYVNTLDLKQMVDEWLETENLTADLAGEVIVNLEDYTVLSRNWLECSHPDDPSCDWTGL